MTRQGWIDPNDAVAVVQQCVLAGVSRATVYAQRHPKPVDESDLLLGSLIDEEYTRRPFYGSRKMVVFLKKAGHLVNRKRVQRLMQQLGLAGMAPGPNTSRPHPEHKIVWQQITRGNTKKLDPRLREDDELLNISLVSICLTTEHAALADEGDDLL